MSRYYYGNPHAPTPTRLHLGTAVAIFREGMVLLDHRRDGDWGLIGGAMELGESLEQCACREIREETGLELDSLRLLGVFSHPSRIIHFTHGEAIQSVTICFAAEVPFGEIRISDESKELRFIAEEDISLLPIVATHRMIVPYLFRPEHWPVIE